MDISYKISNKSFPVKQSDNHFITLSLLADLTHGGLVMPYGDLDLGKHWLR